MNKPNVYFTGIENILLESIYSTKKSIIIAMAWFTNNILKDALVKLKTQTPNIDIQIVVDSNEKNSNYFLDYKLKFEECGIVIHNKVPTNFLHQKFMVIDSRLTISGSYNYSKKANSNLELIVLIEDLAFSDKFSRYFEFIVNPIYVDKNILLLSEYPEFSKQIISTYYKFTKAEYRKYKNKIIQGECFTYENGYFDEISYSPGFIFNPNFFFEKDLEPKKIEIPIEFEIPISKDLIKEWTKKRNVELILDSFRDDVESYHLINDELINNEKYVEEAFEIKIKNTFSIKKLREFIEQKIDIVIEDKLWSNNFELFLNKRLIKSLFDQFQIVEE